MFKIDIFTILSPIFPLIFNIGCLLALFKTYTSPNLLFPILKSKIPKKVLKQPTIVLDEEKVEKFKNDLDSYLVEESKIEKNIVPTEYELDII